MITVLLGDHRSPVRAGDAVVSSLPAREMSRAVEWIVSSRVMRENGTPFDFFGANQS